MQPATSTPKQVYSASNSDLSRLKAEAEEGIGTDLDNPNGYRDLVKRFENFCYAYAR